MPFLCRKGYASFRSLLPTDTQAWNVDLLGEGSIDVGGPFTRFHLVYSCIVRPPFPFAGILAWVPQERIVRL
jgi:hypothetical protein